MSKTVTLRLDDEMYSMVRSYAESDNRSIANFIKTATLRFMQTEEFVDDIEMAEILANTALSDSIKEGLEDSIARRGRFV